MKVLLDRKLEGIKSGWTQLIVHRNANPRPPKEKPVTIRPKNISENTFQQRLSASAMDPNMHIYMMIDQIGYTIANAIMPQVMRAQHTFSSTVKKQQIMQADKAKMHNKLVRSAAGKAGQNDVPIIVIEFVFSALSSFMYAIGALVNF